MAEPDGRRRAAGPVAPVTARLVVPVPELAEVLPDAVVGFLAWSGGIDTAGAGPVREPVLDPVLDRRLAAFIGDRVGFDYALTTLSTFPDGGEYLPPSPALGFRRLGHHLHKEFRAQTPMGDFASALVPHLVVPTAPGPRQGLLERLPVRCHAAEVWVQTTDGAVLARYAFGTSAA